MARIINIVFRTLVNDHVTLLFSNLLFFVNSCLTTMRYYSHLWVICHKRETINCPFHLQSHMWQIIKLHALEISTKLLTYIAKHFSKHNKAKNHNLNVCICFYLRVSYYLCYNGAWVGMIYWTGLTKPELISRTYARFSQNETPVIVQSIII